MSKFEVYPATRERWNDLLTLFGPNGAYWNCWCTFWRYTNSEFEAADKESKIIALKSIVDSDDYIPGLLAYHEGNPIGWMAMSPRSSFRRLVKSRVIKPVDELPVWSIVCFFIHKDYRSQGVTRDLILGGIEYAKKNKIPALEAYPIDNKEKKVSSESGYVGLVSQFEKAKFVKVADTKSKGGGLPKIIMRYTVSV